MLSRCKQKWVQGSCKKSCKKIFMIVTSSVLTCSSALFSPSVLVWEGSQMLLVDSSFDGNRADIDICKPAEYKCFLNVQSFTELSKCDRYRFVTGLKNKLLQWLQTVCLHNKNVVRHTVTLESILTPSLFTPFTHNNKDKNWNLSFTEGFKRLCCGFLWLGTFI